MNDGVTHFLIGYVFAGFVQDVLGQKWGMAAIDRILVLAAVVFCTNPQSWGLK